MASDPLPQSRPITNRFEVLYRDASQRRERHEKAVQAMVAEEARIRSPRRHVSDNTRQPMRNAKWSQIIKRHTEKQSNQESLRRALNELKQTEILKECTFKPVTYFNRATKKSLSDRRELMEKLKTLTRRQEVLKGELDAADEEEAMNAIKLKHELEMELNNLSHDKKEEFTIDCYKIRHENENQHLLNHRFQILKELTRLENVYSRHLASANLDKCDESEFDSNLVEKLKESIWYKLALDSFRSQSKTRRILASAASSALSRRSFNEEQFTSEARGRSPGINDRSKQGEEDSGSSTFDSCAYGPTRTNQQNNGMIMPHPQSPSPVSAQFVGSPGNATSPVTNNQRFPAPPNSRLPPTPSSPLRRPFWNPPMHPQYPNSGAVPFAKPAPNSPNASLSHPFNRPPPLVFPQPNPNMPMPPPAPRANSVSRNPFSHPLPMNQQLAKHPIPVQNLHQSAVQMPNGMASLNKACLVPQKPGFTQMPQLPTMRNGRITNSLAPQGVSRTNDHLSPAPMAHRTTPAGFGMGMPMHPPVGGSFSQRSFGDSELMAPPSPTSSSDVVNNWLKPKLLNDITGNQSRAMKQMQNGNIPSFLPPIPNGW